MSAPSKTFVWRWPFNAQKAHVYEKGEALSLCGRWLFTGEDQPFGVLGETPGRDDCTPCWREAKKAAKA